MFGGAEDRSASATIEVPIKKLIAPIALAVSLAVPIALTGCSATTNPSNANSSAASKTVKEAPKAPDLTGNWKQSNSHSSDSYQSATITGDTISIDWITDAGDTKSIYWIGTFTAPTDATTPYTWTSTRDKAATESALLASRDATKVMTFKDDTISYSAGMLGTTMKVKLKKD